MYIEWRSRQEELRKSFQDTSQGNVLRSGRNHVLDDRMSYATLDIVRSSVIYRLVHFSPWVSIPSTPGWPGNEETKSVNSEKARGNQGQYSSSMPLIRRLCASPFKRSIYIIVVHLFLVFVNRTLLTPKLISHANPIITFQLLM